MSSATFESAKGSAFRARRFGAWSLRRLASRYGELPLHALPGAIPVTDSAAAPAQALSKRKSRQPAPPRADPEYESRLEQLAQSMLGAASEPDQATPAPALQDNPASWEASGGNEAGAALTTEPGKRDLPMPPMESAAASPIAKRDIAPGANGAARQRRPASGGRPANADGRQPAPVRRPARMTPLDFGPDAHGRREPVLDPLAASNDSRGVTPPSSRRLRNSALVVAMLTGIAIGLGSAWWFAELDEMDRALASAGASSGQRTVTSSASATREQQAGLTPPASAHPPAAPEVPGATPKVVSPAPVAVASPADQDGVPDTSVASPSSTEVSKPPVASVDARPARDKSKDGSKEGNKEVSKEKSKPKAVSKERSLAQDSKRSRSQTTAKRSKKPAAVARATQDKSDDDIDRLRSQAYSESSRDREQRVLPKPASPGTAVAVTPISTASNETRLSHKKELAQCEKLYGIIPRERCKWRICDEQWGSNGCPSFPQQAVRF